MTARTKAAERRRAAARRVAVKADEPSLNRIVAEAVCGGIYAQCACVKRPDLPACERMEWLAQRLIDMIRHHDASEKAKRMTEAEMEDGLEKAGYLTVRGRRI